VACSYSESTLETMNPFRRFGRIPLTGDRPIASLYLQRTAQHREMWTYVHASSGIRTYDSRVRGVQDYMVTRRSLCHAIEVNTLLHIFHFHVFSQVYQFK
jgi:hypothetical protein